MDDFYSGVDPAALSTCAKHGRRYFSSSSCSDCRSERQAKRDAVRKPPPPPFRGQPGCNLCGAEVPKGRYSWCSKRCVQTWNLVAFPTVQRKHLLAVFGDVCWSCWDADGRCLDHVRPLWSLTGAERREHRWWTPFNLQLLCDSCHAEKTAREARERARLRHGRRLERAPFAA